MSAGDSSGAGVPVKRRSALAFPERLVDTCQIHETGGPARRKVDVSHGRERHADDQSEPRPFRLHERLNQDVVGKVVRREPGSPHDQCGGQTRD